MDLQHHELAELWEEMEALFACGCLMGGNWPSGRTSPETTVVFLPGLAVDNWQIGPGDTGVLTVAFELWRRQSADWIAIPGNAGTRPEGGSGPVSPTGYPGGSVWRRELLELGAPDGHIAFYAESEVGPDGNSWNTRTEADAFVRIARARGWRTAVVVAIPFHLMRVMLTLVKAMMDADHRLDVRAVTPHAVSWTKAVYHSQGEQQLPRWQYVAEEWKRIPRYQANGSICSFRELREYLIASLTNRPLP